MKKLSADELSRVTPGEFKHLPKFPVHLFIDSIRSAYNVGSVFRSADAFKVEKIWITGISAKPPHKEIEKTALGATESVAWEFVKDPIEAIERVLKEGLEPVALEQTNSSIPLSEFLPEEGKKYCFILGNEVFGVSDQVLERCKKAVEIPQFGTKHSFNVSVSAGILLWDIFMKLKL